MGCPISAARAGGVIRWRPSWPSRSAAKLAGYHGVTALGEFSQALTQHQLRALRAFYSPRLGRFTAPSTTAFFQVLIRLDPDVLDRAARTWAAQQTSGTDPVAIDGKSIRGAARHNPGAKNLLVAAAEHRSGIVLGQEAVQDKSNEIPAVRTLLTGLDLAGRVVTLDALHTCHRTARCVVETCAAHYVMTAVKDNCPHLLADLAGLDWELAKVRATEHHTSDNAHGRIEKRSCRVLDLTEHHDRARLPHRQVAFRIERERRIVKTGKVEYETVHGVTSLPPDQATAEVVLALVRGHWSIENRVHHVRDVSYDEDRCRVRTGVSGCVEPRIFGEQRHGCPGERARRRMIQGGRFGAGPEVELSFIDSIVVSVELFGVVVLELVGELEEEVDQLCGGLVGEVERDVDERQGAVGS